jgi:hypothetical protein
MDTLPISLTLSNILNPPSIAPSSSFQVYTYDQSGSVLDFKVSGLSVTMQVQALILDFSVTPATLLVGSVTTYKFSITHAILTHSVNDYAIISFPPGMTVPNTPLCTPITGIITLTCSQFSSSQLMVTYTSVPSQTISFSLANTQNYFIADQSTLYSL